MNQEIKEIDFIDGKILFSGILTSFKFYTHIFSALTKHYEENGMNNIPTFSFINVNRFDPKVIPNLIGIGLILKQYHRQKIPLEIINSEAIGYLYFINFFRIVGPKIEVSEEVIIKNKIYNVEYITGLDIFNFNEKYLGFFGNRHVPLKYRKEHKTHIYFNNSYEYYKLYIEYQLDKKILEQKLEEKRTQTFEDFELNKVPKDFGTILSDYVIDNDFYEALIKVISELTTNAVLYSYSPCVATVNTNRFSTTISLSDFGIGLEGSIKYKPNFINKITNEFKEHGLYRDSLKDFLLVMDCLQYSMEKKRENLWSLKERIIKYHGTLRIHYNTVQIVFASRCINCNKKVIDCAHCLLRNAKEDYEMSTLRIYSNRLNGFHIEIEIKNPALIQNNYSEL
jgi:hypothetical protein